MSKRKRRQWGMPAIPPGADRLRDAHKTIDPRRTYRITMPDGSTFTTTGAEMIETADAFTATIRPHDDNAVVPRFPSRPDTDKSSGAMGADVGRAWDNRAGLPGFLRGIDGLSPVRRTDVT